MNNKSRFRTWLRREIQSKKMPRHLNPSQKSECLSKDDLQYLIGLLDKAEEEVEAEGDGYRQNKGSTLSTRRRIKRIKSALINFEGNRNS